MFEEKLIDGQYPIWCYPKSNEDVVPHGQGFLVVTNLIYLQKQLSRNLLKCFPLLDSVEKILIVKLEKLIARAVSAMGIV